MALDTPGSDPWSAATGSPQACRIIPNPYVSTMLSTSPGTSARTRWFLRPVGGIAFSGDAHGPAAYTNAGLVRRGPVRPESLGVLGGDPVFEGMGHSIFHRLVAGTCA